MRAESKRKTKVLRFVMPNAALSYLKTVQMRAESKLSAVNFAQFLMTNFLSLYFFVMFAVLFGYIRYGKRRF